MNWKLKALAQTALSQMPFATAVNYWGQRVITRAYRDPKSLIADRLDAARWFVDCFREHGGKDLSEAKFFEFGAGWNLAGPLALYCLGVNSQHLVDIAVCARVELINDVINALNNCDSQLPRVPGDPLGSLADLKARFGIAYEAPADARSTRLAPASIDCVTNTYTMEHIPQSAAKRIIEESRRILKPGGLMLSIIDYQDHYSYRDPNISVYNFLQFTDRQWSWFNSPLHFQNRLRHSEYKQLFHEARLDVLTEELKQPSPSDLQHFSALPIADRFQDFSLEDAAILGSKIVCRRKHADPSPGPED